MEDSIRKYFYIAGLTLFAQTAIAQDITVLVVALVPPLLLAPLCLVLARRFWLHKRTYPPARIVPLLLVSCLEVFLWGVISVSAVMLMSGDWGLPALLAFIVSCGTAWILSGVWFDAPAKVDRWLFFVSPPLALLLLAATTWFLIVESGL
jgi:hypothetical protein